MYEKKREESQRILKESKGKREQIEEVGRVAPQCTRTFAQTRFWEGLAWPGLWGICVRRVGCPPLWRDVGWSF